MLRGNAAMPGVALLAALLLGGCGQDDVVTTNNGAATVPGTKTAAGAGGAGCPELVSTVAISSDSDPTAVLRCTVRNEHVSGEGEWSVTVHERATGRAMLDLLAALRLPSEPLGNQMCTMELRMPTVVRLETASGPVDVAAPKGSCGQTRSEVTDAYQALSWVEVSRARGERLRSEAAVTAGCDRWKDMLAMLSATARDSTAGGSGPPLAPGAKVKVCIYRSTYPVGWTPNSHEPVDGEPEGGGQLPTANGDRVAALLLAAGPAARCRSAHERFAVVFAQPQPLYVELDGCFRILAPDGSLQQGSKELADLLAAG
jgi:hypothetical protein